MGFVAPFIPMIAGGIAGYFGSKSSQDAAQGRSAEEQLALGRGQAAGTALTSAGQRLLTAGQGPTQQATNYWGTLLRGNRAAMAQATAGPASQIRDLYTGAERGLDRLGRTSTTAARADLGRARAGQLASLVSGVQPAAASSLGSLGLAQTQLGLGAAQAGGGIFARLLGEGAANRQYAREEGDRSGSFFGSLIADLLSAGVSKIGRGGGGGGNPLAGVGSWSSTPRI